ncbi:MAG: glutamine amidotransferase-related protein [Longimicrobiales bacterium]
MKSVCVGVIGDFKPGLRSHEATNRALELAAETLGIGVRVHWTPTRSLAGGGVEALASFDALLAAPGSPYQSMEGALAGIEWARAKDFVFLGACGGFQHTVMEFARNVMGIRDADTAEHGGGSQNLVIDRVVCEVDDRAPGAPRLSGWRTVRVEPGSLLWRLTGSETLEEEYFCNYEVNDAYRVRMEAAGLKITARDERGEVRAVELPGLRFFLATLFQPQLQSAVKGTAHPVLVGYLKAAAGLPEVKTTAA